MNDKYRVSGNKSISREDIENSMERCKEIDSKSWLKSLGETYYVIEINGRYYDGEFVVVGDADFAGKNIQTSESLLECERFNRYEKAKSLADKYNCNVRKVIVKVEE
ncbi:hypothetical protein P3U62_08265 [Mammaliicoccus vitulinus]|uniref:hypothetical protein n=1 Tax=Mammaliicoccus vitulinus TaxID=71237 RepID=UPI002B261E7B|nr:hypothetical protein [Mammaliicoccus vitulinus]WQK87045.1 hypothetical protein P3U62_08265 [Mammaliicoccus vitulinus]